MSDFNSDLVIDLFKQRDELKRENDGLKQHIKRLEEAGDAVAKTRSCGCPTCVGARDAWLKAKESKP